MATEDVPLPAATGEPRNELAFQWRRLGWAATAVALLSSPAAIAWLHREKDWPLGWAILGALGLVIAFRGLVDVGLRRLIPWPSLFGTEDASLREADVVARRRSWFWRFVLKLAFLVGTVAVIFLALYVFAGVNVFRLLTALLPLALILPVYLIFNFLILFGPLLLMGVAQIRAYEPGDADWGVRLEDVRGQAEAKEEVRRVISLWQSGEAFERAGGKRERGLLFLGAPGTGKTMLAKAIATGFNSPFVSIPGSGFAQTFIGMDAVIVRWLSWKAKRVARKWGGQCIVFIDEIDAVGRRRSALGGGGATHEPRSIHDLCFYGPWGALTPSGDLIVESREWRERLFAERQPPRTGPFPAVVQKIVNQMPGGMFGGMGQLALNQLLVVMDGIDNPPFFRRVFTRVVNTLLDASYIVPRRVGESSMRLAPPRPRKEQIYFIGATNVPIDELDPALTRPGRLGRHIWFRTPTKDDRKDIFDLYLGKVTHDADLDTGQRRDEVARITNGYSPAMIEQVCSMALTLAHHDGRLAFGREELLEAMTTVESGTAINIEYVPAETRAVAIHEAGHAAAAHVYLKGAESSRLSIRMRGRSLGHHQAFEREERFSRWRHEETAGLIHALGAMAAERVFYGENSVGVGGDVQHATTRAAWMVGAAAMAPERIELNGSFKKADDEEAAREQIMKRFELIGTQIMNRTGGGDAFHHDPIGGVLGDRDKRAYVAQHLGRAYVTAHNLVAANREQVEKIAETVIEKREIYGDELVELLESVGLEEPTIDFTDEATWPKI